MMSSSFYKVNVNHVSDHKVNCNMEEMPSLWGHVMIIWNVKTIRPKWLKTFCVYGKIITKNFYIIFFQRKKNSI